MLRNRSIAEATVIPVLACPDVHEARAWLCEAFGFSVRLRIGDQRVQMNAGEGAVTVREMRGSAAAQAPAPTGLRQHGSAFGATLSARLKPCPDTKAGLTHHLPLAVFLSYLQNRTRESLDDDAGYFAIHIRGVSDLRA